MQSKTLCFNATLFRKNLARFWPLWGMASFLGALFPLALLLNLMRTKPGSVEPLEFTQAYYSVLSYGVPIVSLLYAALVAMMVWSYLYNARSVGLMHTLPIRREGLFATNFLSGMAMMLIPYAVTGGLCVLISVGYGGFDPAGLAVTILGVLGESFFYFASATFAAFIVGNLFALPAVYFLLHFLAVMLDWLVSSLAQGFIFGFSGNYTGVVEWLSPTVYLMGSVRPAAAYEEILQEGDLGNRWSRSVMTDIRLDGLGVIGTYALVGAVLLALGYLLYRCRKSETAGDVVAVGALRPVFCCGVTALSALLGGIALYEIFWRGFQGGDSYDAVPMAVCMSVMAIIGYYAATMLLAKTLRVFRGSWKGVLAAVAACAAVCGVLHADVLGIADKVPAVSAVESVQLYAADNNYTFYSGEEDDLLEQVRALHRTIAADRAYIRGVAAVTDDTGAYTYVRLTYHLKDGRKVEREYPLPLSRARMAQEGTYDRLLDQMVNSEAMKAKRLHLEDGRYAISGGSLYVERQQMGYDLSSREAASVLEAVGRDAANGTWGEYDWFEQDERGSYAMNLNLSFQYSREGGSGNDWITIALRPGMENTKACLLALGLVKAEDFVTYRQLYPDNYDEREWAEEEEYAFYGGAEAAAESALVTANA
ncbi:ABC transporter permease [Dysosmobacter sp.]